MLRGIKLLVDYVLSVTKVTFVFLLALLLPRFFVHYNQSVCDTTIPQQSLKVGLENMNDVAMRSLMVCQFLGMLSEIAPFDIGIGTDKAFQCLMLPEKIGFTREKWYKLKPLLATYGIESKYCRTFNEHKKDYCNGLALCVRDINTFSSFNTLLAVLSFFKQEGLQMSFSSGFDTAVGSSKVREFYQGSISRKELEREVNRMLTTFFDKTKCSFFYKPLPKVIKV